MIVGIDKKHGFPCLKNSLTITSPSNAGLVSTVHVLVPLDQFGNQNIPLPISMSKSKFTIAFPSNTGHISINWYEAISIINPFKQPKCALESKLLNFKNFANCKIFVCLPAYWPACMATPSTKIDLPPKFSF